MTKPDSHIVPISIEEELKRSYLDYAMSVIVARALPDVRDGLKPVHRRILYAMGEGSFDYNKPHKKSARVVGEVISKYHPHGNDPIYGALARMAQNFVMRACLVDGHGNFGSMDGDKPAAMRYTEARLSALAHYILEDYDKETVDFQPNYDDTLQMPVVLPARFPNLLVNGASGIAVGMATNIPAHNLGEVLDACCALIDAPELEDLSAYIKGPDFPTGGIILGRHGFSEAYRTGRGTFLIRGRAHIEEGKKDRQAIIITEIPYQVNKATMVAHIASLVNNKELEGISDLRDESDRHGVRVVIELKKDAIAEIVLNRLYAMTPLQISFAVNMLALHKGRPLQMTLLEVLRAFLEFRKDVVTRRTRYFLRKARERAHLLLGMVVAISHIDEVITLIKESANGPQALETLMAKTWPLDSSLQYYLKELGEAVPTEEGYRLSEEQAKAILAMRLQRLTGMEQSKLKEDLRAVHEDILSFLALLESKEKLEALIKEELTAIKDRFATPRLTTIQEDVSQPKEADLIQCEDMVVTVSVKGYIKRVPLSTYRSQKRGGRGRNAMDTVSEDEVAQIFVADTHTVLLFFTSLGRAYQLNVYELPLGSATSRGKPLIGLFPLQEGETLATLLPLPKENVPPYIVFATSSGSVRKNAVSDFLSIRTNGKIAMKLSADERLVAVSLAGENQDLLLSSHHGKTIRFSIDDLRQFSSRHSTGVRGITLKKGDQVVSMSLVRSLPYTPEQIENYKHQTRHKDESDIQLPFGTPLDPELLTQMSQDEEFALSISEKGFGKRTSTYAYRCAHRGGQGVASMEVTARTGLIVNTLPVRPHDQILLLTDQGQLLRCEVDAIRISGRKTQGVKIFRLADKERIVSVAIHPHEEADLNSDVAEASSPPSSSEEAEQI